MEHQNPQDKLDDSQVMITDLDQGAFAQPLLLQTLTRWLQRGRASTRGGLVLWGILAMLLLLLLITQALSPWQALQAPDSKKGPTAEEHTAAVATSFVPGGQFAYIQTPDHLVTAYRASDGRIVWRRKLAGAAILRATDQLLYCALLLNGDGQISALGAQDGRIVWSQLTPALGPGSPLLAQDGIVYTNTQDGRLFAFRSRDGKQLWSYRYAQYAAQPLNATLSVQHGTATVHSPNDVWHLLRTSDGSEIFQYHRNATLLTIDQGMIFLAQGFTQGSASAGNIQAFRLTDGKLLWQDKLQSNAYWPPAEVSGTVYVGSPNGELLALRATDGQSLWTYQAPSQIVGAPSENRERVYVLLQDGSLVALDAHAGSPLWTTRISAFAQSFGYRPLLQGNTLFLSHVTSWGNEVYALEAASGQILWHHEMGSDNPQHAPILLDGIFCLQQNDDSIDAWRGSDGLHLWHAVPLPSTDQIWTEETSGILYREDITGALDALRISDGQLLWHARLSKASAL